MANWKLKILSGLHEGAEIELANATYIIGNDDDSDLLFSDENIRPRHFQLTINKLGTQLLCLIGDGNFSINGKFSETAETALNSGDIISVGNFHFAVGENSLDWLTLRIPMPDSQTSLADKGETVRSEEESMASVLQEASNEVNPNASSLEMQVIKESPIMRFFPFLKRLIVAGMGVAMAAIPFIYLASGVNAKSVSTEEVLAKTTVQDLSKTDPKAVLELLQQDLKLDQLTLVQDPYSGSSMLAGYVLQTEQKNQIRNWLVERKVSIEERVVALNTLIGAANITLSALGYPQIEATPGKEAGTLVLSGKVQHLAQWKHALRQLQEDVTGIQWHDDVAIKDPLAVPSLNVLGVSIGKSPYFTSLDGEKYFVGSPFAGDFRVENIELTAVVMRRGDQTVKYNLIKQ